MKLLEDMQILFLFKKSMTFLSFEEVDFTCRFSLEVFPNVATEPVLMASGMDNRFLSPDAICFCL